MPSAIHPRNGSNVGADDLAGFGRAGGASDEQVGVALADGRAEEPGWHGRPRGKIGCQLDFVYVIQIKKLLRRGWRAVGFNKSAGNKKWLVFVLAQILDGAVGGVIIAVAFAVAIQNDNAV